MRGKALFACALALALSLTSVQVAQAHGLIGKRFFPATLATDDPFVADELSLPTIPCACAAWETATITTANSHRAQPWMHWSSAGTRRVGRSSRRRDARAN